MENVTLHPLVVINISDHLTRVRANADAAAAPPRVFGAVLGTQAGRRVELANSFELKVAAAGSSGSAAIDMDYLRTRLEQYKKTFPSLDMLGWYSTSTAPAPDESDIAVHQQLCELNEALLYLALDPSGLAGGGGGTGDLPIGIFESEVVIVGETPTPRFARLGYKVDSIESERIAVDHVAHILPSGESSSASAFSQHLNGMHTAINMLTERIEIISRYVAAVQAGTVPFDHALLRQVKALCARLPALDSDAFRAEFVKDHNNSLLVTQLAVITQGAALTNELIDKFNVAYDRHSRRRGIF